MANKTLERRILRWDLNPPPTSGFRIVDDGPSSNLCINGRMNRFGDKNQSLG